MWFLLSPSNSSATSYWTSRSPHGLSLNKPSASRHSKWSSSQTATRQTAFSTGGGGVGRQQRPTEHITTSAPSHAAFCTRMIRGFSCMELTHTWKPHRTNESGPPAIWRCNRKQKMCLIQFILHPQCEGSLSHVCRRVCVERVKSSYSHWTCAGKQAMRRLEWPHQYSLNSAPKTGSYQKFRLWALESVSFQLERWRLRRSLGVFLTWSSLFLYLQQCIQSTRLH